MRTKNRTRMIALALLIGLLAAIPASTQVLSGGKADAKDEANLRMIVLINRLELTREQMETIHDALAGLLTEIDGLDSERAQFYDEMLRFNGTADELDQALSAFRDRMSVAGEGLRDRLQAAIDEMAETLTMKQGEILRRAIPGLFAREGAGPRFERGGPERMREMVAERLRSAQRFSDRDRMRSGERLRGGVQSDSWERPETLRRNPLQMQKEMERKVDLLRLFVETLELKLSYME